MQYGFSWPHVGQVRRAWSALPIATSCAALACRFGFAVVFAVEVGDPALPAVPPQDLGDDVLAAWPKALGAQLADRQQAIRSPSPRVGRQAVALTLGVVELGEDALAAQVVQVRNVPVHAASPLRRRWMTLPVAGGLPWCGRLAAHGGEVDDLLVGEVGGLDPAGDAVFGAQPGHAAGLGVDLGGGVALVGPAVPEDGVGAGFGGAAEGPPVAEQVPQVVGMMSAEGRWVASTGMMPGARPRATTSRLAALNSFCWAGVPTVAEK